METDRAPLLPLDDLFVVDLSRVLAGPFCSMLLGDFGARVVKIEQPGAGDDTRSFRPPEVGGESLYYLSTNRNKESLALDFKHEEGRRIAQKLIDRADILVENFRVGALERIGLGPQDALARNPRLIYVSITGYGHAGLPSYCRRPGYDLIAQGEGGLPSLTGPPDGGPSKVGTAIADLGAGLFAFAGALLALHARHRTGRGQQVDVSLLDGQIALLSYHAGAALMTGREPSRHGNGHPSIVPYGTYQARDGHFNIACGNDALFAALARAIGMVELVSDPRFATNPARVAHRVALDEALGARFLAGTVSEWLARLDEAGVPCGRMASVLEALAHPQVLARRMVTEIAHPTAGRLRTLGVPIRLGETPGSVRTPPPRLGEQTGELLQELVGLDRSELERLLSLGVIGQAPR